MPVCFASRLRRSKSAHPERVLFYAKILSKMAALCTVFRPTPPGKENMKRRILSLAIALLLALSLIGCAGTGNTSEVPSASSGNTETATPSSGTDSTEIRVTDLSGVSVTLEKTPSKVVSLVPSVTELLFALDAGNLIVGRDGSSNYPEQAEDIPVMGDYSGPNLELIVAAEPDVVFTSGKLQAEAEEQLRNAGIAVISAEAGTLEQINQSIELLGAVCGKKEQADTLCAQAGDMLKSLESRNISGVTAYYIVSTGEYGEWTVGPGSFIYDALTLAGVELITKDAEYAYPQYSLEAIAQANPYVIIADTYTTREYLESAEMFKDLDAVKNGRMIFIDADKASRPTLRFFEEMLSCTDSIKALTE